MRTDDSATDVDFGDSIVCPSCGSKIKLTDALLSRVKSLAEEKVRQQYLSILKENDKLKKIIEDKESELSKKLELEREKIQNLFNKKLLDERERVWKELESDVQKKYSLEIEHLRKSREELFRELQKSKEELLSLLKEKEKLDEERMNLQLEVNRQLEEERKKIKQNFEHLMSTKILEYEKKIQDMHKALEEAKMKGDSTSERFRGEVLEIQVEQSLKEAFPTDEVKEVPKGQLGGDVIQVVKNRSQRECGTIVWEVKRTKLFKYDWIQKLKDDVNRINANFGIIVTQTMPEDAKSFVLIDGVWICDFSSYIPLISVLRSNLFEIQRIRDLNRDIDKKASALYDYITSDQFKNKVTVMIDSYMNMRSSLEEEKRAFMKIWAKREKEIQRLMESTMSIIGNMEGLVGNAFPKISGTELPQLD